MLTVHRLVALATVWGLATAFGLSVAAWTSVGPVLLRLSWRHGVHLGDLLAFAAAYAGAAALTQRLLLRRR